MLRRQSIDPSPGPSVDSRDTEEQPRSGAAVRGRPGPKMLYRQTARIWTGKACICRSESPQSVGRSYKLPDRWAPTAPHSATRRLFLKWQGQPPRRPPTGETLAGRSSGIQKIQWADLRWVAAWLAPPG